MINKMTSDLKQNLNYHQHYIHHKHNDHSLKDKEQSSDPVGKMRTFNDRIDNGHDSLYNIDNSNEEIWNWDNFVTKVQQIDVTKLSIFIEDYVINWINQNNMHPLARSALILIEDLQKNDVQMSHIISFAKNAYIVISND